MIKASGLIHDFNKIIGVEGDFVINNYKGVKKITEGVYEIQLDSDPNIDTKSAASPEPEKTEEKSSASKKGKKK